MSTQGKKLLVADDSLTIQKVIRLALSNEGYDIQTVSDGNDAIQQISLFRPAVILIDVSLPGKTAFEVKKIINDQGDFGDVKFILMSSAFEKVDEDLEKTVRFDGRLTKPFDPAHLRQVLSEVIAVGEAQAEAESTRTSETTRRTEPSFPSSLPLPTPTTSGSLKFPERPNFTSPSASSVGSPPQKKSLLAPPPPELTPPDDPIEEELDLDSEQPLDLESISIEPRENLDALWNEPKGSFESPQSQPEISDIRHLTESTMRMTGLDDFDWSVNEESAKKNFEPSEVGESTLTDLNSREPSLPPLPGMKDLSGSNFSLDPTPLEPPRPSWEQTYAQSRPSSGQHSADDHHEHATHEPHHEHSAQEPPGAFTLQSPMPPRSPYSEPAPQLSSQQVEEMISRQVQEQLQATLERFAQKVLPEVAEKLIKQEIRRMLEEQP